MDDRVRDLEAELRRLEDRFTALRFAAAIVQEYVTHRKGCPSYPHGWQHCDCGLRQAVHRMLTI